METIVTERVCKRCGLPKPVEQFHRDRQNKTDGRRSKCRQCESVRHAEYHATHREENNRKHRAYFEAHKDMIRNNSYQRLYGITLEEYQDLYEQQGGKCAVCDMPQERLHVDHNHKTNKVRGLLCNGCNAGLGQLREDPKIIESLNRYLLKYIK